MEHYSVMTFNLLSDLLHVFGPSGFAKRVPAIEHVLETYHPDIIGTQEMTYEMFPYLRHIFRYYGTFGDTRHSVVNNEYTMILYRKDRFNLIGGKTVWLSPHPEKVGSRHAFSQFPRIVTYAYLQEKESGRIFTFANTHLDVNFRFVRKKQAEKLCEILEENKRGDFLCLTGDFNSNCKDTSIQTILNHGYQDLVDCSIGTTLRGKIGSTRFSHMPIDHIFLDKEPQNLQVRKAEEMIEKIIPSDHYPVCTTFDI